MRYNRNVRCRISTVIYYTGGDNMAEPIGIIKEIDAVGRLVIPKEMREVLGLQKQVEIVMTADGVLVRNPKYRLIKKEI